MNRFASTQTVGEIVAVMPQAGEIFKHYGIDFCCGGNRHLSEAVKEKGLDENEVLQKLDEAFEESKRQKDAGMDFMSMSSAELIRHIENTHHAYLRKTLPELSELTVKIMRVHGANHQELFKVHKLFSTLRTELEQHLIKEEEFLFPLIKASERESNDVKTNVIGQLIKETHDEHETAGDILKELRKITKDYKVPDDTCSTYALAYKTLEELEADLFQHIHLENNILFKKWNQV